MKRLVYRIHAIQRMFQRQIDEADVKAALATGETIEDYPDDTPYPSRLILGWRNDRPLHVVTADSTDAEETIIITAYEPTLERWEPGFKKRRQL